MPVPKELRPTPPPPTVHVINPVSYTIPTRRTASPGCIIAIIGPGLENVIVAVGIFSVPLFARVTRGQILSLKEQDFIVAARMMGAQDGRIMLNHLLPNAVAPLLVLCTLRIATAILTAASLSFLGLGAQPPLPEWGAMLNDGRAFFRTAPHVIVFPGLAIIVAVLGFNGLVDRERLQLAFPDIVDAAVGGDLVEPRGEGKLLVEMTEGAKRLHEDLLRQVLDLLAVPDDPGDQVVDLIVVFLHQPLVRRLVSAQRAVDQFQVLCARVGSLFGWSMRGLPRRLR